MNMNVRSRSPGLRNKRSLSISSLSSGSLNDGNTSYISHRSNNESTKNSHYKDRYSGRSRETMYKKGYTTSNIKYNRNKNDKKNDGFNKEESYLTAVANSYKNIQPNSVKEKPPIKTSGEDSQRDPSTCNFQGIFYHTDVDSSRQDTSKTEGKKDIAEETGDRLERLEKLVETLLKTPNKTFAQTSIYQDNLRSERDPFELIPRNTTFTTSMWLNKIDEECMARDFDEKTCIKFIQSKMTGTIKAWFKTLSSSEFTWPELKMLIIQTFPDNTDFAATLSLLVERNIGLNETIQHYYYSKMYLLEACKISGENAVSCLIHGLQNQQLKEEVKHYNFITPEALYSQFLSKLPAFDDVYLQDAEQETQQETSIYEASFLDSYETDVIPMQSADHYSIKPKIQKSINQKSKKCFTCKKFGHIDVDCRHAPICYNCKRTGHIALNCPLNN